jgi:hypothetical protein
VSDKSPRKSAAKKPAAKTLKEKRSAKKLKNSDGRQPPIIPPAR